MNRKLASVIILNFNGKEYLPKCLGSLKRQTYSETEVILVDNASIDGSVQYVQKNFPWVKIVQNSRNIGFAEGNDEGANYASGDYLVFLNYDTEVDSKWLERLIEAAETYPDVAVCGSKILDMERRDIIQEVGGLCDAYGFSLSRGWGEIDRHQYKEIIETFYVSGASLLIKKKIAEKIGLFDPKYFFNQEDVDVCWRAHLVGYKVVVNPLSIIYHKGGGSALGAPGANIDKKKGKYLTSTWRRYFAERNILRTVLKNYSILTLAKLLPTFFFMYFSEIVLYILTSRSDVAMTYLNALWWNARNIKDTWFKHKEVQMMRKVGDHEIRGKMVKGIGKLLRLRQIGFPQFK
jgi:GT2 family glycosyltransferase